MIVYSDLTDCQKEFSLYYIIACEGGGETSVASWGACTYGQGDGDYFTIGAAQWMGLAARELLAKLATRGGYSYVITSDGSGEQTSSNEVEGTEEDEELRSSLHTLWLSMPYEWRKAVLNYLTGNKGSVYDQYWWQDNTARLTDENYNAWINAIINNVDAAINWQSEFWKQDMGSGYDENIASYIARMQLVGMDINNIKTLMYYVQAWHNAPEMAKYAYSICGDTTDLAAIGNACLNWLASNGNWTRNSEGWTNRYSGWAITILDNWDGTSCPPDNWGTEGTIAPSQGAQTSVTGDRATGVNSGSNAISCIMTNGQDLFVIYKSGGKLLCRQAMGNNVWIPVVNGGGNGVTQGSTSSSPATDPYNGPMPTTGWKYAPDLLTELNAVMGTFTYNQNAPNDRNWRVNGGITDCSGLVWWGIDYYDPECAQKLSYDGGAGYTGSIYYGCGGTDYAVAWGYSNDRPTLSDMLPGDLVMYNYKNPYFTDAGGDSGMHVGMYFGDAGVIDMGGTPGPTRYSVDDFLYSALWWVVLRPPYSEVDDPSQGAEHDEGSSSSSGEDEGGSSSSGSGSGSGSSGSSGSGTDDPSQGAEHDSGSSSDSGNDSGSSSSGGSTEDEGSSSSSGGN